MANAFVNAAGDVTSQLTDYIVAARWTDLPDTVRHEALRSFFNILGCTIGGAQHEIVELADSTLGDYAGRAAGHGDRPRPQSRCAARLPDQLPRLQHLFI